MNPFYGNFYSTNSIDDMTWQQQQQQQQQERQQQQYAFENTNYGNFSVEQQSTLPPKASSVSSSSNKGLKPLPVDYTPSDFSVILGRGKGSYNHIGNKRCRVIVKSLLSEFNNADTRSEKAVIVSKVLQMIKQACPIGAFIKNQNGNWYEVDTKTAREKCFTMFRDCQNSQSRKEQSNSAKSSVSSSAVEYIKRKKTKQPTAVTSGAHETFTDLELSLTSDGAVAGNVDVDEESILSNNSNNDDDDDNNNLLEAPLCDFTDFDFDFDLVCRDDESITSSNCGSFYDIDSCSLCTI